MMTATSAALLFCFAASASVIAPVSDFSPEVHGGAERLLRGQAFCLLPFMLFWGLSALVSLELVVVGLGKYLCCFPKFLAGKGSCTTSMPMLREPPTSGIDMPALSSARRARNHGSHIKEPALMKFGSSEIFGAVPAQRCN